jgi:mono/diheme cytochrome c family protein
MMTRLTLSLIASGLAAGGLAAASAAAPIRYTPPPETARLAPGPNVELAQVHCGLCHSADYVTTQPRNFANPRAVWTGEVGKMRKVYGATLTDEDSARIVDYLVAAYGK